MAQIRPSRLGLAVRPPLPHADSRIKAWQGFSVSLYAGSQLDLFAKSVWRWTFWWQFPLPVLLSLPQPRSISLLWQRRSLWQSLRVLLWAFRQPS